MSKLYSRCVHDISSVASCAKGYQTLLLLSFLAVLSLVSHDHNTTLIVGKFPERNGRHV